MKKGEVLKIIDEALSNTVSGMATKALLDVRAKVKAIPEEGPKSCARLKLVDGPLNVGKGWFEGAKYIYIETSFEVADGVYGAFWYE